GEARPARGPGASAEGRRSGLRLPLDLGRRRGARGEPEGGPAARRRCPGSQPRGPVPPGRHDPTLRVTGADVIRARVADLRRACLLCAAYFLAAQAGRLLSSPNHFATFWPP